MEERLINITAQDIDRIFSISVGNVINMKNKEMVISDFQRDMVKKIMDNCIHEYSSGRLWCTTSGLIQISKAIGLDYKIMGKYKRKRFRVDIISSYQMGVLKLTQDYEI